MILAFDNEGPLFREEFVQKDAVRNFSDNYSFLELIRIQG